MIIKFQGYLLLNTDTGKMRVITGKYHSPKLSPYEIMVRVSITIDKPANPSTVIQGTVKLPEAVIKAFELQEEEVAEEQVAEEQVAEEEGRRNDD